MKRGIRSVLGVAAVMGLAWVSFSAQGCKQQPTVRDACQTVCDCYSAEPCPAGSPTIEECVKNGEAQEKVAREAGCSEEFDAYIACVANQEESCGPDACEKEDIAYDQCGAMGE